MGVLPSPALQARPVWRLADLGAEASAGLRALELHWREIRDEVEGILSSSPEAEADESGPFEAEAENLRDAGGDWSQLELFKRGRRVEEGCRRAPR